MKNIFIYDSQILQIASSLVYFSTTQTRRYIFPCLTLMVFQILNALILLPTQTAFTYYLWPMISLVSIHIIDTMTLFLTLTLHSWSTFKVYIHCVFPNHGCFEIISHTNCINLSLAHGLKYGLPNHWYYENASQTEFMCNSCNTLVHAPCLSKSGCISDECFLK